jgi:hypothetical protein
MNAIVKRDDLRKAVLDSLSNPSEDIARHVLAMAGANPDHIEKSITTGTGLVAYDLQAPAKNLVLAVLGLALTIIGSLLVQIYALEPLRVAALAPVPPAATSVR